MHQMHSGMFRGSTVAFRSQSLSLPSRGRLRVRMARAPWEKFADDGVWTNQRAYEFFARMRNL